MSAELSPEIPKPRPIRTANLAQQADDRSVDDLGGELEKLTGDIVPALKTVYDPEIPADIYELGLIYKVDIDDSRYVSVDMTLTAPGCPVAGDMPVWVEDAVAAVPAFPAPKRTVVFDPPWSPERMSDEAKVAIGWW